jgi:hypothetical protein
MAHNLREHIREGLFDTITGSLATRLLLEGTTPWLATHSVLFSYNYPATRIAETEADQIGLELLSRAGYDPLAAQSVFKKMLAWELGERDRNFYTKVIPRWTILRTHPLSENRQQEVDSLLPKVQLLYLQASHASPSLPLTHYEQVNFDYLDDFEHFHISPIVSPAGLVGGGENLGIDIGYGIGFNAPKNTRWVANLGIFSYVNDKQSDDTIWGGFIEPGWAFSSNTQIYTRWARGSNLKSDPSFKNTHSIGFRWGSFNSSYLFIEWRKDSLEEPGHSIERDHFWRIGYASSFFR